MSERLGRGGRRAPFAPADFPSYTAWESAADRAVHAAGLAVAAVAVGWLLTATWPSATLTQLAAVSVYCLGLIGTLSASALYNLAPPSRLKGVLRRADHAMIFVMIAGSYTPFTIIALRPQVGLPLCGVVWGLAAIGVALKFARPPRAGPLSLALYLGMGWLVLGVIRPLAAVLPGTILMLLLAGGVVYTLGAFVHAGARVPFHNAIWHAMVAIAAALHFAAVALLFPGLR